MLKASRNNGKGPEYKVLIPEWMNPTLSPAEKKVVERMEELKAEDPKKTDLELLKEELRRVIETMSKNNPLWNQEEKSYIMNLLDAEKDQKIHYTQETARHNCCTWQFLAWDHI